MCCSLASYMEPVYASLQLIEQGKQFLMRDRLSSLQVKCPIRILHGVQVRRRFGGWRTASVAGDITRV